MPLFQKERCHLSNAPVVIGILECSRDRFVLVFHRDVAALLVAGEAEVVVNPVKSRTVTFGPEDHIVVIG